MKKNILKAAGDYSEGDIIKYESFLAGCQYVLNGKYYKQLDLFNNKNDT